MAYTPPPGFSQESRVKKANHWWWIVALLVLVTVAIGASSLLIYNKLLGGSLAEPVAKQSEIIIEPTGAKQGEFEVFAFPEYGFSMPLPASPIRAENPSGNDISNERKAAIESSDPNSEYTVYISMTRSIFHRGSDPTGMADAFFDGTDKSQMQIVSRQFSEYGGFKGEEISFKYGPTETGYELVGFSGQRNKVAVLFYVSGPDLVEAKAYFDQLAKGMKQERITR